MMEGQQGSWISASKSTGLPAGATTIQGGYVAFFKIADVLRGLKCGYSKVGVGKRCKGTLPEEAGANFTGDSVHLNLRSVFG